MCRVRITYIEKDASINQHIEQMRLSATKALLERPDAIIVATVSSIYGLGDPECLLAAWCVHLVRVRSQHRPTHDLLRRLAELQYTRNEHGICSQGDIPRPWRRYRRLSRRNRIAMLIRIELFDDEIESSVLLSIL